MRLGIYTAIGLLLIVGLIGLQGIESVVHATVLARWGIPVVVLLHGLSMGLAGLAWCVMVCGWQIERSVLFMLGRWIREGVNDLLPVAQIGGHVVGARVLTIFGWEAGVAGGSVVVDVTMRLLAQLAFTFMGLAFLLGHGVDHGTLTWILSGLALSAAGIAGFILAQRRGLLKLVERGVAILATRWNLPFVGRIPRVHDAIEALYRQGRRMIVGIGLHLAALLVQACEIWVLLYAMDTSITFGQALLVESLALAIKSVAFSIPGALGIQEGGYVFVGALIGLPPSAMLAVSLIKRLRDIVLGVPALLLWRSVEGDRAWGSLIKRASV